MVFQLDMLSEVVKAVAGRCEIYMDGGIRTGTDVFKALALGARAVFVGRPVIYGLAYNVRTFPLFRYRMSVQKLTAIRRSLRRRQQTVVYVLVVWLCCQVSK